MADGGGGGWKKGGKLAGFISEVLCLVCSIISFPFSVSVTNDSLRKRR